MEMQDKLGKGRMVGYAIGAAIFVAVIVWKLVAR